MKIARIEMEQYCDVCGMYTNTKCIDINLAHAEITPSNYHYEVICDHCANALKETIKSLGGVTIN